MNAEGPSLNRRAFLRGMAEVGPVTEGQTLTRRQFTLVALIAAIVCAFLPNAAARKLLAELFGTQEKTNAFLRYKQAEIDAAYRRLSEDLARSLSRNSSLGVSWMHPNDYREVAAQLGVPQAEIEAAFAASDA